MFSSERGLFVIQASARGHGLGWLAQLPADDAVEFLARDAAHGDRVRHRQSAGACQFDSPFSRVRHRVWRALFPPGDCLLPRIAVVLDADVFRLPMAQTKLVIDAHSLGGIGVGTALGVYAVKHVEYVIPRVGDLARQDSGL